MTTDQIIAALSDRKITIVAKRTGISLGTLYKIQRGQVENIRVSTITRLAAYLQPCDE
jgi:DNA-binding Xre family transcriptional regulator